LPLPQIENCVPSSEQTTLPSTQLPAWIGVFNDCGGDDGDAADELEDEASGRRAEEEEEEIEDTMLEEEGLPF
jgi:hypothetical protein